MLRPVCALALLIGLAAAGAGAQQSAPQTPVLQVHSTLVEVPVLVKTKAGQVVFALKADDFLLTDNGEPRKLTLNEDTDSRPLALAIVVETGGAGAAHLADYRGLDAILTSMIGGVRHRVGVIAFGSTPRVVLPFTPDTDEAARSLDSLRPGDAGAAIFDAVTFAVAALSREPDEYRRAILLLSETVDQGSETTLEDTLRRVTGTNTAIYSFAFSSTRSAVSGEAARLSSAEPGPAHGCFSREGEGHVTKKQYGKQVLDCISQLAPPLRLATMSFLAARSALRRNAARSIAELTGGEYAQFHNAKDLQRRLIAVSNDIPNYYVLSFRPATLVPGMHALEVKLRDRPGLRIQSRSAYWIGGSGGESAPAAGDLRRPARP